MEFSTYRFSLPKNQQINSMVAIDVILKGAIIISASHLDSLREGGKLIHLGQPLWQPLTILGRAYNR